MFCVFSMGNKDFAENMYSASTRHFHTYFFDGKTLYSRGNGRNLLLISSEKAISSHFPCVNVFSKNYKSSCGSPSEKDISIVSSENKELLTKLAKTKCRVITCGMGAKDTVTCTSIFENTAVIAIQRTICDVDGRFHMPSETPIKIHRNCDIYEKMAEIALLTILGVNI